VAQTLTRQLATFAAELTYDDLPAEVALMAKQLTLDTLGTALAATTLGEGCRESVDAMRALGGKPESTILGFDVKVSAPNAAFANGALAHALNYDAIGEDTGHTGVTCLTAPLAAAEAAAPVSGKRFLAAAAVAAEVTARVTLAVRGAGKVSDRILAGQYFNYFGAAAGAGNILGIRAEVMHSAFGLAVMQVAGSRQVVIGGDPPAKAVYGAFPNHAGYLSVLLAHSGLKAEIDALDGKAGFFGLATDGRFDATTILDGLGERFIFLRAQFKPWPTSGHVAPFIEGSIELATRHDLQPSDIAAVELVGHPRMRDWFEPPTERRRPANAASAANSTMFAAAKALSHRAVVLADFTPEGLRDEPVLALADRITYRLDDRIEGGIVIVTTTDGRELTNAVEKPLGHPSRPISRERLEAKFRDCCSYAPSLSSREANALVQFIDRIEDVPDVCALANPSALLSEV
jgi:2-methylcitrate dehydratase PrpD